MRTARHIIAHLRARVSFLPTVARFIAQRGIVGLPTAAGFSVTQKLKVIVEP